MSKPPINESGTPHGRRPRRRPILLVAAVVLALAAVTAVVVRMTHSAPISVRSCRLTSPLTPAATLDGCGLPIVDAVTARVTRFDTATGRTMPDLAESITTPDQQEFTIRLAADRRFSDGTPVTARDLVRAWNHVADCREHYPAAYLLSTIAGFADTTEPQCSYDKPPELDGLTLVDDHTLIVRTSAPDPELPARLSHPATAPLPEIFYSDPAAYGFLPVGAGPFLVAQHHENEIVLRRSPTYSGPFPAATDEIRLPVYLDGQEAYNDIARGRLDVTDLVPTDRLIGGRAHRGDDGRLGVGGPPVVLHGLRVNDPQLTDPRKRRALSMAVDRDFLAERLYAGTRRSARGWIPAEQGGSSCGEACTYDPDASRALWDAAGGYDGTLYLWGTKADADYPWLDVLCNEWKLTLGVDCLVALTEDSQELRTRLDAGFQDGLIRWEFVAPIAGPAGDVARYLPLLAAPGAAESVTTAVRDHDGGSLEPSLRAELPVIPLWFSDAPYLSSRRVDDVRLTPMATIDLTAVRAR